MDTLVHIHATMNLVSSNPNMLPSSTKWVFMLKYGDSDSANVALLPLAYSGLYFLNVESRDNSCHDGYPKQGRLMV